MKVCTEWTSAKRYSAVSDFIIMPPLPLTLSPAPSPFLVIFVNVTVPAFTLLSVPLQGWDPGLRADWPGLLRVPNPVLLEQNTLHLL